MNNALIDALKKRVFRALSFLFFPLFSSTRIVNRAATAAAAAVVKTSLFRCEVEVG